MDIDLPAPKITNFKEAIQSLDDVQQLLESRGYIEEAFQIGSAVDTLTILKINYNHPNRYNSTRLLYKNVKII